MLRNNDIGEGLRARAQSTTQRVHSTFFPLGSAFGEPLAAKTWAKKAESSYSRT